MKSVFGLKQRREITFQNDFSYIQFAHLLNLSEY